MSELAISHGTLAVLLHAPGEFSWMRGAVHWDTVLGSLLWAGLYLAGIGPLRRRHQLGPPVGRWRIASFLAGTALLLFALNGPLHDLSDYYLFSAHMVQHLLLVLFVPPLWLLGTPGWLWRPLLKRRGVWPVARFFTLPLVTFIVYNVVMVTWHIPAFYNAALLNHDLHILQHLTFIAAAMLMWWPVVGPLPELIRISPPMKMLYVFAYGIPMSIVAALIALTGDVLYPFYAEAPRVTGLSPLEDQQLGGLIMWVPAMKVYWVAITIIFFHWSREERRRERQELKASGEPVPAHSS